MNARVRLSFDPARNDLTIERALRDRNLFGNAFSSLASWGTWLAVLKSAFAIKLTHEDLKAFKAVASDLTPPSHRVRELWCIAGRRSGKSRMAAAIGAFLGACVNHTNK